MIEWKSYAPRIEANVVDCPKAVVIDAIRQAAIEFCRDTLFLEEYVNLGLTVAGQSDYTVTTSAGTIPYLVEAVYLDGTRLRDKPRKWLDTHKPMWRAQAAGTPQSFFVYANGDIGVYPRPAINLTQLTATVYAVPAQDSTGGADELYNHHANCIAQGALANLFSMTGYKWSDANKADYHRNLFNERKAIASRDSRRDHANKSN